MKIRN